MKALFTLFVVLFALTAINRVEAQTIKLDSLWGKYVGTVYAMCFTPDSKYLLVAFDNYRTTIFDAQTGEELRTFKTHYGCFEMKFSNDGTKLYSFSSGGVDILDATTFTSLDTVSFSFPSEEGATQYDVTNDGKYFVVKNGYEGINTDYYRMRVISYPEKKVVWTKDLIRWQNNFRNPDGKVTFTNDDKFVLGQNQSSLCKWDWKDSLKPPVFLIDNLPNNEIKAYSSDKNIIYIKGFEFWSIVNKSKLQISESFTASDDEHCLFTIDGKYILVNDKWLLKIVSLEKQKVILVDSTLTGKIAVSSDFSILARKTFRNVMIVDKVNSHLLHINDNSNVTNNKLSVIVKPTPSTTLAEISINAPIDISHVQLSVFNSEGQLLKHLYSGELSYGKTIFNLNTVDFSSGVYQILLVTKNINITKPLLITK
ncbi:MAG: hypothetical protein U0Y96_12060 [Candidatus Kapaibacterium sp.]